MICPNDIAKTSISAPIVPPGKIIAISGHIASGKSELGRRLSEAYGAALIKTRDLILRLRPKTRGERFALQRAGERLDRETEGTWVADQLFRNLEENQSETESKHVLVIDAVRIKRQIDSLRKTFGTSSRVIHVHLTASKDELVNRYARRAKRTGETASYDDLSNLSRTERQPSVCPW